jgi:hypothetical protein
VSVVCMEMRVPAWENTLSVGRTLPQCGQGLSLSLNRGP